MEPIWNHLGPIRAHLAAIWQPLGAHLGPLPEAFSSLFMTIVITIISISIMITLTILIISYLSWLALRTLKEGREALTEINKDRS